MDKGSQEKVAEKKHYTFEYGWSVVCTGCKMLHEFDSLQRWKPGSIRFPKGDFSVISVYCGVKKKFYDYANEDVMRLLPEVPDNIERSL